MKYKLPKEFATKWLQALRSGKYKQGKNRLCSVDGEYCCLGVAGEVAGNDVKPKGKLRAFLRHEEFDNIPDELIGDSMENGLVNILSVKNDSSESFDSIADWIEQNVELY